MRNLLSISFFMIFTLATCCVFAQNNNKQNQSSKQDNRVQTLAAANAKYSCWKITGENGDLEFRWDTEANVRQWINEMQSQHNETYTYKSCNHKTVDECDANNEKSQPKKCWKITATKNGQSYEQYLWSTETVARRKVSNLQADGYLQAKYVETPANDEKSCHAPETETNTNTNPNQYACWKITIGITVTYLWSREIEAQNIVNNARNSGQTASYELSPDKTKDNCR